jgi:phage gpG-like protein
MSTEIVTVDSGRVKLALSRFGLSLKQRGELLKELAAGMLVSVRRTFREQGSPAGSWAPLSPRTIANKNSKASGGRKILILSGRLLNSIEAKPTATGIVVGTNLVYARVQQEGSKDRGAGEGPQARIAGRSVTVGKHSRSFLREIHYGTRAVVVKGRTHHVPVAMTSGMHEVEDKRGRKTKVRANYQGPRLLQDVSVREHEHFQNIPARPYLVIRPEDPARIRGQVIAFVGRAAGQAGLATAGGGR